MTTYLYDLQPLVVILRPGTSDSPPAHMAAGPKDLAAPATWAGRGSVHTAEDAGEHVAAAAVGRGDGPLAVQQDVASRMIVKIRV